MRNSWTRTLSELVAHRVQYLPPGIYILFSRRSTGEAHLRGVFPAMCNRTRYALPPR